LWYAGGSIIEAFTAEEYANYFAAAGNDPD
jgi:hypothetical protein